MRIVILTLGTRGDLELFLLLARTLKARGHQLHLVTSHFHAARVIAAGIECTPVGSHTADLLDQLLASLAAGPDLVARTRAYVEKFLRPELAAAGPALEKLAASADYFVSNLKISVARNGTILPTAFVTYDPPAEVEELNRYTEKLDRRHIMELVAMPQSFAAPDTDWPPSFNFTGFWLPTLTNSRLPPTAETFLTAGKPPIVLTTGSMRMYNAFHLAKIFATALADTGNRGILLGFPNDADPNNENIFCAAEIPYPALFPHVAGVIHHGSVGAAGEALRTGKPSIVLPQIVAQQRMAEMLMRLELASAAFNPATVSADELASAITTATAPRYAQTAATWKNKITKDHGVVAAATQIEAHWSRIAAHE